MIKQLLSNRRDLLIVGLILSLAATKYFYQALVLNPFEIDQEFLALEAWNFLKEGKATLIGAHTSVGGMYIGPFYTYFITLLMGLTKLNPYTINVTSAFWATLTPAVLYVIGRKLFSREVGLVAGLLAAISISYLHISEVPPLVVPMGLVSLLTFYCLSQLKENRRMFFAAVFLSGVGIHLHFTGLYLLPFVILWILINRITVSKRDIGWAGLMLLFFLLPLIAFDLRHDFLNSRNFVTFILASAGWKAIVVSMLRSFTLALANLGALFNNTQINNLLISSFVWAIFVFYFIFTRKRTPYHKLLILWLLFPMAVNGIYTGDLLPYYYIFHHPQIFLVIGLLLERAIRTEVGATAFITLSLLYTLLNLQYHHKRPNQFRLQHKMAGFETILKEAGTTNVNVSLTIDHARRGGFDFLRRYYGFDDKLLPERSTYTIVSPHYWHRLVGDYTFGEVDVILPKENP